MYNALGLTTQVPATLTLASTRPRRCLPARLRAVVRPAPEVASDVPLLQWLEVLRDVRRIPDTTPGRVVVRVADYLRQLPAPARRRLTALAARQAPPARARHAGGPARNPAGCCRGRRAAGHPQPVDHLPPRPQCRHLAQSRRMEHPMTLHHDRLTFAAAVAATAQELGLAAVLVEKDYWVSYVLRALADSS